MDSGPSGVPTSDLIDGEGMSVEELAAALGEEVPTEEAAPEPAAEAPEPERFKHEPTGKEFDSEMELLRYESGWKDNKYGNELKEVRAKLEAYEKLLDGAGAEPARERQVDPKEQEKILLERALQGTGVNLDEVDAGAYKTIFKMIENALGMYDNGVVNKRFEELRGSVEKITTRAQEAEALNKAGINIDQVREVLEKYPQLKALPPTEQVAVIADLAKAQAPKQGKPETDNALRQALQPDVANHVEGSASTGDPMDAEQAVMKKASELSDKELLAWLGQETAKGPKPWDNSF